MKAVILLRSFVLFLLLYAFAGCSKSHPNSQTPDEATFSFEAGDSTYAWNGDWQNYVGSIIEVDSSPGGLNPNDYSYLLLAEYDSLNFSRMVIWEPRWAPLTPMTSLSTGLGSDNFFFDAVINGYDWILDAQQGDTARIAITSIHNHRVDGTFSGTLSNLGRHLSITHGAFHNVKINP